MNDREIEDRLRRIAAVPGDFGEKRPPLDAAKIESCLAMRRAGRRRNRRWVIGAVSIPVLAVISAAVIDRWELPRDKGVARRDALVGLPTIGVPTIGVPTVSNAENAVADVSPVSDAETILRVVDRDRKRLMAEIGQLERQLRIERLREQTARARDQYLVAVRHRADADYLQNGRRP